MMLITAWLGVVDLSKCSSLPGCECWMMLTLTSSRARRARCLPSGSRTSMDGASVSQFHDLILGDGFSILKLCLEINLDRIFVMSSQ